TGSRFKLAWTRAFVTAILNGSLREVKYEEHPIFGLHMPTMAPGVPDHVLNPRNTWQDKDAYDAKARQLAKLFRENDAKFEISNTVRAIGPKARRNEVSSDNAKSPGHGRGFLFRRSPEQPITSLGITRQRVAQNSFRQFRAWRLLG